MPVAQLETSVQLLQEDEKLKRKCNLFLRFYYFLLSILPVFVVVDGSAGV